MSFSSIRLRVLLIGLLPALLAIFALSVVYITARLPEAEESVNARAIAVAQTLAVASEYAVVAGDANQLDPILASAFETKEIIAVRIFRNDGSLLVERLRPSDLDAPKTRELVLEHLLFNQSEVRTRRVPIYSTPIEAGFGLSADQNSRRQTVAGYLDIEINLLDTTLNQAAIIRDALFTGLALFLLSIPFVIWLGRSITRPLLSLSDTVDALTGGDYKQRAMFKARGELRILRDGINRMARHIQNEQERLQQKVVEATEDLEHTISELHAKTLEANQQRKAAERTSEFKSRLVANVSHEIRTPLNAILGFAELLEHRSTDPHQQQQLATLQRSAGNLLDLVNDLLDFSRLESGGMPWELVDTDINELLNDLRTDYAPQTQAKNIEYFVRPVPEYLAVVRGDRTRLRQALVNLVSNAIKFTERGHVMVDVESQRINASTASFTFRVIDTGIGIDNEQLQLLFTAFAQGDMSINRRFGGTGLGLHIFSEIIALMNGEIIAHGTPGLGSVFGFRAEFELCEQSPTQLPATPTKATGTIALYSRYQPLHHAIKETLQNTGYRVIDGNSEAETEEQPDLSIVCFTSRELNELHLPPAGQFRRCPGQRVIAGIYSTDDLIYEQLDHLGYDGTLNKAMSSREIQAALQRLMDPERIPELRHQPGTGRYSNHYSLQVLVVDDQEINLRLMAEYLQILGCESTCLASGEDALEHCKTHQFDLILLDLHMPNLDGLAITRLLRAQEGPNQNTPALAVTADSHPKRQEQAQASGLQSLLVKPVSLKALDTAISTWCQHNQGAPRTADKPAVRAPSSTDMELLSLLLRDLPMQRRALHAAVQEKNAAAIFELAHTLDGNSRYCPTPELQGAAAALANAAIGGWTNKIKVLSEDLDNQIDHLLQEFTSTTDA